MSTSKQFTRRSFLRGLGGRCRFAVAGNGQFSRSVGRYVMNGKTITRYPDPAVEVIDPRFAKYKIGNAVVERLWTGARWSEGPVWFGDGGFLL